MSMRLAAIHLVVGLACFSANAQTMERSVVLIEPLQYSKNGVFNGCGLNVKFFEETPLEKKDFASFSINLWLDTQNAGLAKTTLKAAALSGKTFPARKVASSWFRVQRGNPVTFLKSLPGEEGALLHLVSIADSTELFNQLITTPPLQLGIREAGMGPEVIFFGTPEFSETDKETFGECLSEISSRIEKQTQTPVNQ